MTLSQPFLVFRDLNGFEEYWLGILLNVPQFELSDISVMIRLGLWVFRKNATKVKCFSHHIIWGRGTLYQHNLSLVMLTLIAWLRKCLPGIFSFRALFFGSKSLSPAPTQRGFCHFYNEVLCLIFNYVCPPTAGDEGLFKGWQGSDRCSLFLLNW